jgi:predicted metallo-beta-lactamase superfamily hydrolase
MLRLLIYNAHLLLKCLKMERGLALVLHCLQHLHEPSFVLSHSLLRQAQYAKKFSHLDKRRKNWSLNVLKETNTIIDGIHV